MATEIWVKKILLIVICIMKKQIIFFGYKNNFGYYFFDIFSNTFRCNTIE